MSVPCVKVGIFNEPEVKFVLYGKYRVGDTIAEGECLASVSGGKVLWAGKEYDNVLFTPSDEENDCFELKDVTIGVNFHWER